MLNPAEAGDEAVDLNLKEPNGEGNVEADMGEVGFDLLDDMVEASPSSPNGHDAGSSGALLNPEDVTKYRERWDAVQSAFIDDPTRAVEQADNLVDLVIKRLTESFTRERDELTRTWDHGGDSVSTEDLRLALRGYRALLDRLMLL